MVGEVNVLLKMVCYTCGVTILGTRYCSFSPLSLFLRTLLLNVAGLLCIVLLSCMYLCYHMCIVLLCVYCCLTYFSCRMLARSQYLEGPATGHLGTGFTWFPCV